MEKLPDFGATRRMAALSPTKPDYVTWSLKETWSVSEAGKLVCGRNPYDKFPGPQHYNRERRVIDIIDLAYAAAQTGTIKVIRSALLPIHLLVDPASFIRWAVTEGLTIPEDLSMLAVQAPASLLDHADLLIKERVTAIARTLWILNSELTEAEIVTHPAMRQQISIAEALMADKLRWVAESRQI